MKPGFLPGVAREIHVVVTEEMCPAFDGVVVHRCYSTWSMVHHMEIAARKVLVDFLEPHEEGIGAHVSVDHLSPCPVGRTVRVRAELTEVTADRHPRVICKVTAHDDHRLLAQGLQIQVVMNKSHLKKYLEKH
jgi:predicted thioesterase